MTELDELDIYNFFLVFYGFQPDWLCRPGNWIPDYVSPVVKKNMFSMDIQTGRWFNQAAARALAMSPTERFVSTQRMIPKLMAGTVGLVSADGVATILPPESTVKLTREKVTDVLRWGDEPGDHDRSISFDD